MTPAAPPRPRSRSGQRGRSGDGQEPHEVPVRHEGERQDVTERTEKEDRRPEGAADLVEAELPAEAVDGKAAPQCEDHGGRAEHAERVPENEREDCAPAHLEEDGDRTGGQDQELAVGDDDVDRAGVEEVVAHAGLSEGRDDECRRYVQPEHQQQCPKHAPAPQRAVERRGGGTPSAPRGRVDDPSPRREPELLGAARRRRPSGASQAFPGRSGCPNAAGSRPSGVRI